jgi:hypothetical protein
LDYRARYGESPSETLRHAFEKRGAAASAYYGMRAELQNVDQRVAKIEATLQQVANVLVMSARQDERLIAIERRLDRLEPSPGHR